MSTIPFKGCAPVAVGATALLILMAPGAAVGKARSCGPMSAATLVGNSQVRVYKQTGKGVAPAVFGCVRGSRRAVRIGPIPKAGRRAAVRKPIALVGKWVGGVEERPDGKSGTRVYVVSRNIGSGKGRRCLIGSGEGKGKAPAVHTLLMSQAGGLAWGAITPTPDGRAPLIGACDSQGNRVLDSGAGVELDSMRLKGSTLSWLDAGGQHSAHVS